MKKMKNDNKGFTLVELIVVLVILAILAAILVPALLGYIDEAKNSQLELHGKSVYTAAQASASKFYAKTKNNEIQNTTTKTKGYNDFVADVRRISEMASFATTATDVKAKIVFANNSDTTGHDYFTIVEIYYTEDAGAHAAHLYNGSWESVTYASGKGWGDLEAMSEAKTGNTLGMIEFAAAD